MTPDVLVIGGGVAGVSLAAELSSDLRVTLLEAEDALGYHASGRSAAVFVPNYGDAAIRALSREARAHFDSPDPEFWPTPLLRRRGMIRVATREGVAAHHAQIDGAPGVETISPEDAARRFPILRADRFAAASWEEDVHDIDADALLQGYARQARARGAAIERGARVVALEREDGLWEARDAAGRLWRAPLVANAAGAWGDEVARLAGVGPTGLAPKRRSVAVLPLPATLADVAPVPFCVTFPMRWYAKAEAGRLLVSPGDEAPAAPHDAYADDMNLAEGLARFEEDCAVEVKRLEASWAGLRTFTPSGAPLVGWDEAAPGFFWFVGQGGFGVQTAPALAKRGAAAFRSLAAS